MYAPGTLGVNVGLAAAESSVAVPPLSAAVAVTCWPTSAGLGFRLMTGTPGWALATIVRLLAGEAIPCESVTTRRTP